MKYLFLEYSRCSTCRKAKKWLDGQQVSYEARPIIEQNPTRAELEEWTAQSRLPLKKFFNTSGVVYKEMQLKDKLPAMTDAQQLDLLASDGRLVKRPLLVGGGRVLVGFKEEEWKEELITEEK